MPSRTECHSFKVRALVVAATFIAFAAIEAACEVTQNVGRLSASERSREQARNLASVAIVPRGSVKLLADPSALPEAVEPADAPGSHLC